MFDFFHAAVSDRRLTAAFRRSNPDATRPDVEQYLLAFDSDLAPIVGQRITLSHDNAAAAGDRLSLLQRRAGTPFTSPVLGGNVTACDLVASTVVDGRIEGFLFDPTAGSFITADGATVTDSALRARAVRPGHEATSPACRRAPAPASHSVSSLVRLRKSSRHHARMRRMPRRWDECHGDGGTASCLPPGAACDCRDCWRRRALPHHRIEFAMGRANERSIDFHRSVSMQPGLSGASSGLRLTVTGGFPELPAATAPGSRESRARRCRRRRRPCRRLGRKTAGS